MLNNINELYKKGSPKPNGYPEKVAENDSYQISNTDDFDLLFKKV